MAAVVEARAVLPMAAAKTLDVGSRPFLQTTHDRCYATRMSTDTKWIIGTIVPAILVVAGLLSAQIAGLNARIDDVNARFGDVNARIGDVTANVNARFDDMNANVNTRFDDMNARFNDLRGEMNRRLDNMQADIREMRVMLSELLKGDTPADD